MGKFLRVLVVFIFLLAIASLTLAVMLFVKREILKGRAHELEQGLITLGKTIEAEPPAVPENPENFPARDISTCTDEILDNPQTSDFWDTYKQQLESLDHEFLDVKAKTRDLMSYYKIDQSTGKPWHDPVTGAKTNKGEGTTQGVIDWVIEKAGKQYDLLTETRQQLETIRIELVNTINDLNGQKKTLREKLHKIVELNNQITELNNTISNLRNQIDEQKEQISSLEEDISNLEQEKRKLEEENDGLKIAKEELKSTITELRGRISDLEGQIGKDPATNIGEGGSILMARVNIPPGVKGKIKAVDQDHQFVVVKIDDKFISELRNVTTDGKLPYIALLVKRGDSEFITKIRIKQLNETDKLLIGDILVDWQQAPIKVGDLVYYQ
jgi:FtsZ-binding cell division protein ZapB